jgi:CRP-like cAMP-binding protein
VTQHIFTCSIDKNPIFKGNQELIDFLINEVKVAMNLPED